MDKIKDNIIKYVEESKDLTFLSLLIKNIEEQHKRIRKLIEFDTFEYNSLIDIKANIFDFINASNDYEYLNNLKEIAIKTKDKIIFDNAEEDQEDLQHYQNNKKNKEMYY